MAWELAVDFWDGCHGATAVQGKGTGVEPGLAASQWTALGKPLLHSEPQFFLSVKCANTGLLAGVGTASFEEPRGKHQGAPPYPCGTLSVSREAPFFLEAPAGPWEENQGRPEERLSLAKTLSCLNWVLC